MKFAIRKLAITCVLPTALWQGPLLSDVLAQNVPSAISKSSAGLPQRLPAKKPLPAQSQPAGARGAVSAGGTPLPVIQPTSSPQQQQPAGGEGGETGVQRELRLLYEKAGREMPVMDLNEMEVGEPQPGVAPGTHPGSPAAGTQQPGGQYAQPQARPAKAPNFFERVFLGKKTPAPQPAQQTRAAVPPVGQFRSVPPRGTAPAANYRPYQPQQAPQVTQGQSSNTVRPSVTGGQPPVNFPQQQPRPIVQQPQAVQSTPQINPRQSTPTSTQEPLADERLLEEDPEESLDIDLNPQGVSPPTVQIRPGVIPPPAPPEAAVATKATEEETELSEPTAASDPAMEAEDESAPVEENPFSGLQLNTPDGPADASANPATAAAKPSAAANASLTPQPKTVSPPANSLAVEEDAFFDDDEDAPQKKPVQSATGNRSSTSASLSAETDPFLDDPIEETSKPTAKPAGISIVPLAPPVPVPVAITPKVPAIAAPVSITPKTAARTATAVTTPRTATSTTTPRAAVSTTPRKSAAPAPSATNSRTTSPVTSVVVKPPSVKTPASVMEVPSTIAPLAPVPNSPSVPSVAPIAPKAIPDAPVGVPATSTQSVARQTPSQIAPAAKPEDNSKKLAEARETSGLKGFCPVALRQKRQLIESKIQFNSTYRGKKYHFSSAESKVAFEKEPQLYAPAHAGQDAVALADGENPLAGTLDFAAWFQGRLYLFATRDNMARFVDDPELYLDEQETIVSGTAVQPATVPQDKPQPKSQTQTRTSLPPKTLPVSNVVPNKPGSPVTPKSSVGTEGLPLLPDFDDLAPLAPPTTPRGPIGQAPAPLRSSGTSNATPTKDAPPPVLKPATTPRGPKMETPLTKESSKTTPASFTVPATSAQQASPPKLINPGMRLAPSAK